METIDLAGISVSPLSAEGTTNKTYDPSTYSQRATAPLAGLWSTLIWLIIGTIALALILMI